MAVPPGWYADPPVRDGLRYWDGGEWTTHTAVRRHPRNWVAAGGLTLVVALVIAAVALVLAVASSNACGMFGDGCDDYGEPADGFVFFVATFVLSGAVAIAAFFGTVVAAAKRARRRGG